MTTRTEAVENLIEAARASLDWREEATDMKHEEGCPYMEDATLYACECELALLLMLDAALAAVEAAPPERDVAEPQAGGREHRWDGNEHRPLEAVCADCGQTFSGGEKCPGPLPAEAERAPAPPAAPLVARTFPVLNQSSERLAMPRSVPWAFVEAFRRQAEDNHDQTLEQLARRGGLAPEEMWLAANGLGCRDIKKITERDAIAWLVLASALPEPAAPDTTRAEQTEWRGSRCGIVTPNDQPDTTTYRLGDVERCTECSDDRCVAVVQRKEINMREPHDFGWALLQLKSGAQVSRAGWNGKGMFLFLVKSWTFTDGKQDNQPLLPFIAMQTVTGAQVPWLASQTDVLADDWTTPE